MWMKVQMCEASSFLFLNFYSVLFSCSWHVCSSELDLCKNKFVTERYCDSHLTFEWRFVFAVSTHWCVVIMLSCVKCVQYFWRIFGHGIESLSVLPSRCDCSVCYQRTVLYCPVLANVSESRDNFCKIGSFPVQVSCPGTRENAHLFLLKNFLFFSREKAIFPWFKTVVPAKERNFCLDTKVASLSQRILDIDEHEL